MTTSSHIVNGALPNSVSGTVDLTVTGIGTVSAAIIFANIANATNNPQDGNGVMIGLWTPSNQHGIGGFSADATASSNSESGRCHYLTKALMLPNKDGTGLQYEGTVSAITDGIRITCDATSLANAPYVSVMLITGATNAYVGSYGDASFTGANDITAPGFKPSFLFAMSTGMTPSGFASSMILGTGVVHNDSVDAVTQGNICYSSLDNQLWSRAGQSASNTAGLSCSYYNTILWNHVFSGFDASGFTVTTDYTGNQWASYLALQADDPDNVYVGLRKAATSTGNQAITGLGFEPTSLALLGGYNRRWNDMTTGYTAGACWSFSDATTTSCHVEWDDYNDAAIDNESRMDSANFVRIINDRVDDIVASLSSLDSDGYTLNWSNAAAGGADTEASLVFFSVGTVAATGPASPQSYLITINM